MTTINEAEQKITRSINNSALKYSDLSNADLNDWCPGCGDNGIRTAQTKAIVELAANPDYKRTIAYFADNGEGSDLSIASDNVDEVEDIALKAGIEKNVVHSGLKTKDIMVVTGIGCSAKLTNQLTNLYTFHSLHGRALPVAQGVKLANWDLEVIVSVGDGDGLGIGGNHFFHAGRKNLDMTIMIHDNQVYGLTKGQTSPTMLRNMQTKSMAAPAVKEGINPIAAAVAAQFTFVAMSSSNSVKHQVEMIKLGVMHKGTAVIDILQTCPTYNDIFTNDFFKGRVHDMNDLAPDYDPNVNSLTERNLKLGQAYGLALEGYMRKNPEDGQPECFRGVYYQDNTSVPLEAIWAEKIGKTPLAYRDITNPARKETVRDLMSKYRKI